jgi:two-component system sensor histidine kinase KdpD
VLIAQLLSNLIDNALKYSSDKVTLSVEFLQNKLLQISVKDLGPGIPVEERESIFEAYTHSRQHDQSSTRGAGLGLAVCRAIARAHGGDLVVKARQTNGSNFVLRLPVANTELNQNITNLDEETP